MCAATAYVDQMRLRRVSKLGSKASETDEMHIEFAARHHVALLVVLPRTLPARAGEVPELD